VRNRVIQQDLRLARAVFNWAVTQELLRDIPMKKCVIPSEKNPRRGIIYEEDYVRLVDVASRVSPLCKLALVLAHETGHRINAIRLLRWSDVDFDRRTVRWRAENDKQGEEHTSPLSGKLLIALRNHPRDTSEWLFPSDRIHSRPLGREVFVKWWGDLEQLAGLAHIHLRGWHSIRRKWATERKREPVTDVAAAGGWKSTQTLL
jgi:integrase